MRGGEKDQHSNHGSTLTRASPSAEKLKEERIGNIVQEYKRKRKKGKDPVGIWIAILEDKRIQDKELQDIPLSSKRWKLAKK